MPEDTGFPPMRECSFRGQKTGRFRVPFPAGIRSSFGAFRQALPGEVRGALRGPYFP